MYPLNAVETIMLAALFAQVILTFGLYIELGRRRYAEFFGHRVQSDEIALKDEAWSDNARKASNAVNNQFQLPVLFYVACLIALWMRISMIEAILAWLFVISRYVHAGIHITTNNVRHRHAAFFAGFALLAIIWIALLVRFVFGGQ